METFSPIVINSKKAEEHLANVKVQHADMLRGIQDQAERIRQFKAEKDTQNKLNEAERQKMNLETEKMKADSQKSLLEQENKKRELEIKAMALEMP